MGQIVSKLNLLKEKVSIFHLLNEAKTFYCTDLFPGTRDWFNGLRGNLLNLFILCCLFIFILIDILFSLCRILAVQLLTHFPSPRPLSICETSRDVSEEGTIGPKTGDPKICHIGTLF